MNYPESPDPLIFQTLNRFEKSAILLLSLDQKTAKEIYQNMTTNEQVAVGKLMAQMKDIPQWLSEMVQKEYLEKLQNEDYMSFNNEEKIAEAIVEYGKRLKKKKAA